MEQVLLWAGAGSLCFSVNLRVGFLAVQILFPQLGVTGFNKKGGPGVWISPIYTLFPSPRKKLRFDIHTFSLTEAQKFD
jgi:hypothetical protein